MPLRDYLAGSDEDKARGLFSALSEQGEPLFPFDDVSPELAMELYRGMVRIRVVDERMMKLQRQGRIGFYGEARGQEAAVVGTAAALKPQDWLVPALREAGAGLYRGMSLSSYVAQIMGSDRDVCRGRQMPCHPCDRDNHYVVMSSCVSSQIPHAVGIAMAMKIRGVGDEVCIGYMGDGGTSEPDFHVALNFAGVTRAPVVLVCQNNQWAISTPGARQTAAETIALKGIGYGVEALRVDGNDVIACYLATDYATKKARRGDGPTFLELLTYRVSAHSSSDDPSQYRDEAVTAEWIEKRDPLRRMESYLENNNLLDAAGRGPIWDEYRNEIDTVVAAEEKAGSPPVSSLIEDVYEAPTWRMEEQMAELLKHGEQDGD